MPHRPDGAERRGAPIFAYVRAAREEINEVLPDNQLKPYTSSTIKSREALKKELETIAEEGYALDNEELDLGVRCVAAPIRDYTRRIVGSSMLTRSRLPPSAFSRISPSIEVRGVVKGG